MTEEVNKRKLSGISKEKKKPPRGLNNLNEVIINCWRGCPNTLVGSSLDLLLVRVSKGKKNPQLGGA